MKGITNLHGMNKEHEKKKIIAHSMITGNWRVQKIAFLSKLKRLKNFYILST